MNWNNTPCALHTELLEERGGDDGVRGGVGIWVQESRADDADEDDGEATPKDLRAVAYCDAAGHGAQVSDNLGYGNGVGGEVVLVGQHGWVEILGSVGLSTLA